MKKQVKNKSINTKSNKSVKENPQRTSILGKGHIIQAGTIQILPSGKIRFEINVPFRLKDSEEFNGMPFVSDLMLSTVPGDTLGINGIAFLTEHLDEVIKLLSDRFIEPKTDEEINAVMLESLKIVGDYYRKSQNVSV